MSSVIADGCTRIPNRISIILQNSELKLAQYSSARVRPRQRAVPASRQRGRGGKEWSASYSNCRVLTEQCTKVHIASIINALFQLSERNTSVFQSCTLKRRWPAHCKAITQLLAGLFSFELLLIAACLMCVARKSVRVQRGKRVLIVSLRRSRRRRRRCVVPGR